MNVLKDPRRVFNLDESAFFLHPARHKVFAAKGAKSVTNVSNGSDRECVTVLLGGNASDDLAPPMIVLDYVRIPKWTQSLPADWTFALSKSGWMNGETFFKYVSQDFLQWINRKNIPLPVVLFVDGHKSHMTLLLSEFCSENGIILVALCPNATHVLQPMDVSLFRPLKNNWTNTRDRKIGQSTQSFKKEHVPTALQAALDETMKNTAILPNGFRACGKILFV